MRTTRKCNICNVVTIQSDRLTCSRCMSSPLEETYVEDESPDPYYEIYRKKQEELLDEEED